MNNNTQFTLGHVHIKVKDLSKAVAFYTDLLGLTMNERVGNYIFLSYGRQHHDLAIHQVPSEAKTPRLRDVGLYHVAFEVPDIHRLKVVFCKLKAKGVPVRPIDHGISKVIYFDDPDGNGIEVYVDTRKETGRREWLGESGPLNLEDE